jgi:hypothetical protein
VISGPAFRLEICLQLARCQSLLYPRWASLDVAQQKSVKNRRFPDFE